MAQKQTLVGWREWVALPQLGLARVKAKIDTGARTSTLHAFAVKLLQRQKRRRVQFKIHPIQQDDINVLICEADVLDERWVTDSGGHRERRFVIKTPVMLGNMIWPIEITLTNRDSMQFRMLLGRSALHERLIVDPSQSFLIDTTQGP